MALRTIRTGIGTYLRPDGIWADGYLGAEVEVHEDDLERFDRLNPEPPVEEPAEVEEPAFPEGEPTTDWTNKQLDAYAEAHSIDLAGASTKADKVAAIAAA